MKLHLNLIRAHDQESTNHNARFAQGKSRYLTIFFIVFPEKMYWLTFRCFHFVLLLIFQDPFKYRNVSLLWFFFLTTICYFYGLIGLWRTRQTEDTDSDPESHVKTTLRELIIYLVFITILCICELTNELINLFYCYWKVPSNALCPVLE